MSKFIRNHALAIVCTFALAFAAATGVEAQVDDPILDDDILCSITVGDTVWVAPVALQNELEAYLNGVSTVERAADLMLRLPPATPSNSVRLEGGTFGPGLTQDLEALGYMTRLSVGAEVPGATIAFVHAF